MTGTTDETLLVLDGMGVPLYSARGLSMSITPTSAAKGAIKRTVNGEAVPLVQAQMFKYDANITCKDQEAPSLDGVFAGKELTVHCPFEFCYLTVGGSPNRGEVSGSSRTQGDFTYYRPVMIFIVVDWDLGNDEYPHDYNWKLALTEK